MLVIVPFGGAAPIGGVVVVTSLTSGNFDSLVSLVGYNAGDTSVSFYAQVDPNATGAIQLTVTSLFGVGSMVESLQSAGSIQSSLMVSTKF